MLSWEAMQDIAPPGVGSEGDVSVGLYGEHGWRKAEKLWRDVYKRSAHL